MCLLVFAFFLKEDCKVHFCLVVVRVQFQNLLVMVLGIVAVTLFFIDDCEVKVSRRVCFFVDSNLQKVNCLVVILLVLVIEHSEIKVSFKVFWVHRKGFLVQLSELCEKTLRIALCSFGNLAVVNRFYTLS